jgi:hypothetical protein
MRGALRIDIATIPSGRRRSIRAQKTNAPAASRNRRLGRVRHFVVTFRKMRARIIRNLSLCGLAATLFAAASPARCDDQANPTPQRKSGYFANWFARVDKSHAEQPHWVAPLATTTPRLEEEVRYDILWQTNNNGITGENYGGGKGLELMPLENVEVILSVPPYMVHNNPAVPDGYGDFQFLIKYRLLARNEEHGNYILTAFVSVNLPTGSHNNGALDAIITPTFAYGKGFGQFDVQGTFGVGLPSGDTNLIGRTYLWNNTLQYRVFRKLWPEVEFNATAFQQGKNSAKRQVFVTPGVVIGRLHLYKRLNLTIGGGFQTAATHFHTNNHNAIFSIRFPF